MLIKQYVIVRSDLKNYTTGMLIAQGVHACTQALQKFSKHPETIQYLIDIDTMTTVVLKITKDETEDLKKQLKENNADFTIWMERPEMIETAIALRPMDFDKNEKIKNILNKLKLFR